MSLEKLTSIDTNLNNILGLNLNSTKSAKKPKETASVINDEFCYTCNEGGQLINCDRCPASFHLLCHDPPLDVDQIPKGEFLCNKCQKHSKIGINPENKTRAIHFEKFDSDSPLDTLCRMAESLNPKEMNLSSDLNLECKFQIPGLSRIKWFANEYRLKSLNSQTKILNSTNKQMCQVCSKFESSRKMIKCDYCESIYHQDCLFSLINEIPTKEKIWMCPLHCEHILNNKFLKSDKLSDKITLWNKFQINSKSLNRIESEFIKKCQSKTLNDSLLNEKPLIGSNIPNNIKKCYDKEASDNNSSESCFDEFLNAAEALCILSNKSKDFKIQITSLDRKDLIRPRALLKFVSNGYDLFEYPILVNKNSTTIGNSIKSDICLKNELISCKHLCDKHATIFYDYSSDKFEILNYSIHGTKVDNLRLGLEIEDSEEGFYEGSVELKHGSLIQIGCFKFLFVIIDYGFKTDFVREESVNYRTRVKKTKKSKEVNSFKHHIIKKLNQIKEMNFLNSNDNDLNLETIGICKFINNSNKRNLIC